MKQNSTYLLNDKRIKTTQYNDSLLDTSNNKRYRKQAYREENTNIKI